MNYDNVVEIFLKKLPELANVIDKDERDLPNVALGAFALNFLNEIGKVEGSNFVDRSVDLLNEMFMS